MVDSLEGEDLANFIGLISLGGGLPSSEYFPFEHLDIKVPTAPGFSPEETKKSGTVLRAGKHDIQEGKSTYGTCPCSCASIEHD